MAVDPVGRGLFTFLVGGKAGEGVKKAGSVASSLFADMGRHVCQMDDYQSLIRGGHNFSVVSTTVGPISSHYMQAQFTVSLDDRSFGLHRGHLAPDGVMVFVGDGDTLGEGLEHVLFAAKRNADITVVVHDNGVYALTTGQYAPTSVRGYRGPSTPTGSVEEPLRPLPLLLQAGATFVARGFAGRREQLTDMLVQAVLHPGFSFIDVLQPCVTFNNTWQLYNGLVEPMAQPASSYDEAMALARRSDPLPIGVLYRADVQPFHQALYGDRNPVRDRLSREERLDGIARLLQVERRAPSLPSLSPRAALEMAMPAHEQAASASQ